MMQRDEFAGIGTRVLRSSMLSPGSQSNNSRAMSLVNANSERTAVLFLAQGKVLRQLRFSEFEAVLDRVGAMGEFSASKAQAVFLEIDGSLRVRAAVFFLLEFDADGYPDPQWNLPLPLLASEAQPGPDMGAGPIRLATRSRCPVAWHRDQLWDPPLTGTANPFDVIARVVKENRLGMSTFSEPDRSLASASDAGQSPANTDRNSDAGVLRSEERTRLARRLKAARRRVAQLRSDQEQRLVELHSRHRRQLLELEQAVASLQLRLGDEHRVSAQLKQTLDAQAEHFGRMRALISQQIGTVEDGDRLGQQLGEAFNVRLDAATAELQELLERKDVELFYRDGEIKCLGEKIARLEHQNAELANKLAGSDFLHEMSDAGISFVAMQPGAGEFRVPLEDIPAYLQSPQEYAARFCYVDIQHYRAWLEHNCKPVCMEIAESGRSCGLPVHRCGSPATFEPGESDRCSQHKASSMTLRQVMQSRGA